MKKFTQKIILLMSMALLFVTIPFALTACDFGGKHEHSFGEWCDGYPATCYSSGQKGYYYCTKCGKRFDADKTTEIYDIYIDISDHQLEYHEEKAPTCSTAGHYEYWECTVCDEIFLDRFGDQPVTEWDIYIEPTREHDFVHAHDYVEPTCTTAGCCEYWKCQNCHKWFYSNDPDSIPIDDEDDFIIPAQHFSLTEYREQSASCTTTGTKEYWECDDCGKKFSDSYATKEITNDSELVIPARGHTITYVEGKENTHSKSGCIEHWKCTRCYGTFADKEATQSINARIPAGHNFDENGQCKYCDQEEYSAGLTFKLLTDSDTYQVNCGGFTQGDLVIPARYIETKTGAVAKNVTHIVYASNHTGITSVTIPKTIKTIAADAFKSCTGLTAVYYKGTIEDWIKISFGSIYSNPLYYAKNLYLLDEETGEYNLLTSLTLSDESSISAYAFAGCTSLTSITANKASIGTSAFAGCTNLESISLPFYTYAQLFGDGQTPSNLKTINYTRANGMTKLNSNTFSAHYGNVENLTIPDGIEKIDYDTFKYFTNLKTIILPDTISLFYRSFTECAKLQYNEDDNGLYLGTKTNKYAYLIKAKSTDITSLTVNKNCLAVSSYALDGCTKLKSLTTPFLGVSLAMVSSTDGSSYDFQYWFGDLSTGKISNIETLKFSNNSLEKVWVDIPSLTSITLPTQVKSVTLRNCRYLTNLTIPDGTTALTVYNCDAESLTTPWLSNIATIVSSLSVENVTITKNNSTTAISDSLFSDITSLETIVLPAGIKTIGESAFKNCTALTSITIPNSVTSLGNGIFSGCTSLKSIDIPNSVTSIGSSAFSGCTALTSVTISNSITTIGNYAFYKCTSLTSVTIPNSVTSIEKYAFSGCTALTSVTISNSATSIGEYAFSGCTALTSVTIGENVTSIGSKAFYGCTALTNIIIPNSVTSIGEYAFSGSNITIYCEASSKPSGWNSKWNNWCSVVWGYTAD